ncbi:MAG: 1-deoxy-D-xylulose-5-phosphate synthase [Flavobacteriaceae bacterium]
MKWLAQINEPSDLRSLAEKALPELAAEVRARIIEVVSVNGGHLGASLGAVELTLALHYCLDTPRDLLVWDVGHQTYAHKIISGRNADFGNLRKYKGMSPFPKRSESSYDTFGTGHSSTSISAALGMATASALKGDTSRLHVAVIGDASLASGMAFEALNHLAETQANVLVVLNDNNMGIDKATGALRHHLQGLKQSESTFFKSLSLPYQGPIDGHDLTALTAALNAQKSLSGPRVLHVRTLKGKGLASAEADQVTYHAPGKFEPKTGARTEGAAALAYQEIFSHCLEELFERYSSLVAVTPAMLSGSGLLSLKSRFDSRVFDVGIAEQHAVSFSAGLATQGLLPICALYSTFAQRAYDQIIHDVALQELPVIFAIDRSGLVGADGPTHHGVFDIAYLKAIPSLEIFAPLDAQELVDLFYTLVLKFEKNELTHPVAIRYPRGSSGLTEHPTPKEIDPYRVKKLSEDQSGPKKVALISTGAIAEELSSVTQLPEGVDHFHCTAVKPLDVSGLQSLFENYKAVLTLEDAAVNSSFGSAVVSLAQQLGQRISIECMGIPDRFITHGSVSALRTEIGLDAASIIKRLQQTLDRVM